MNNMYIVQWSQFHSFEDNQFGTGVNATIIKC